MLKRTRSGVSAGVCIALGGSVFLACESRVIGAVLFSVALLCISYLGYALFTGRVGFLVEKHDRESVTALFAALLGNAIGTLVCGSVIRFGLPALGSAAETLWAAKLTQAWWQTLIRAFFCGVLMYLAVAVFRDRKTPIGILFCIPTFILSGFEHSIADLFYLAAAGAFSVPSLAFLGLVLLGNAAGAMLLPLLDGHRNGGKADGRA